MDYSSQWSHTGQLGFAIDQQMAIGWDNVINIYN